MDEYTIKEENGFFKVYKNGIHVGSFNTREEAQEYINQQKRKRKPPKR